MRHSAAGKEVRVPLEESDREFMTSVGRYLKRIEELAAMEVSERSPLGDALSAHLGADATMLPVVTEDLAPHRLVDADIALDELAKECSGSLLGVTGGEQRFHSSLSELVANQHTPFGVGAVSFSSKDTGPDSTRRVVAFGVRLLTFDGVPVAVVQRAAAPQFGRENAQLEVMAPDQDVASSFLDRVRALMIERSVLRGKVLAFTATMFGQSAGATFLRRPDVPEDAIVLQDGVLQRIVDHVVGIGEHRQELLDAGQHLKRGVLLYGPPGTGKTLTVRHLLSRTPGVTAVVLTGSSIQFIGAAAELARTFQPSLVVLEDIDLVAMERTYSPQPLLFEVLDALDGLDSDADVAFVMTTNRVQVLERALAARPGRVDLGVEISLPDVESRRRLFRHYAGSLPLSGDAVDAAAAAAENTTGSFAKELMRRTVLTAALRGGSPTDEDLATSLEALLSSSERLTRQLLGGRDASAADQDADDVEEDGDDEDMDADMGAGWSVAPGFPM
jgi:DNA polymerase III delta prime subunit